MSLKKLFKRIGLALAVAGTAVFATGACSIPGLSELESLVKEIVPGLAA